MTAYSLPAAGAATWRAAADFTVNNGNRVAYSYNNSNNYPAGQINVRFRPTSTGNAGKTAFELYVLHTVNGISAYGGGLDLSEATPATVVGTDADPAVQYQQGAIEIVRNVITAGSEDDAMVEFALRPGVNRIVLKAVTENIVLNRVDFQAINPTVQ